MSRCIMPTVWLFTQLLYWQWKLTARSLIIWNLKLQCWTSDMIPDVFVIYIFFFFLGGGGGGCCVITEYVDAEFVQFVQTIFTCFGLCHMTMPHTMFFVLVSSSTVTVKLSTGLVFWQRKIATRCLILRIFKLHFYIWCISNTHLL